MKELLDSTYTNARRSTAPEVVGLVVRLSRIAGAHGGRRLQERRDSVHHIRGVQLRSRPVLQPEAPAACTFEFSIASFAILKLSSREDNLSVFMLLSWQQSTYS